MNTNESNGAAELVCAINAQMIRAADEAVDEALKGAVAIITASLCGWWVMLQVYGA